MFESSVKENGDLCVSVDGVQKNGNVLGISGALFLARFSANLATDYNEQVKAAKLNEGEFHGKCFDSALTQALMDDAYENMTHYGRLLALKSELLEF